jgi:hypothetical protein
MSDVEWERLLATGACPAPRFLGRDGMALWNTDEINDWCAVGRPYRWHWEAHVHSEVPLGVFISPEPCHLGRAERDYSQEGVARKRGEKWALLEHYGNRQPQQFAQYDGFSPGVDSADHVMRPDAEGHCLFHSLTWELMAGAPVRVLIPATTSKEDAVALLRKIANLIEHDGVWTQERQDASDRECRSAGIPF